MWKNNMGNRSEWHSFHRSSPRCYEYSWTANLLHLVAALPMSVKLRAILNCSVAMLILCSPCRRPWRNTYAIMMAQISSVRRQVLHLHISRNVCIPAYSEKVLEKLRSYWQSLSEVKRGACLHLCKNCFSQQRWWKDRHRWYVLTIQQTRQKQVLICKSDPGPSPKTLSWRTLRILKDMFCSLEEREKSNLAGAYAEATDKAEIQTHFVLFSVKRKRGGRPMESKTQMLWKGSQHHRPSSSGKLE